MYFNEDFIKKINHKTINQVSHYNMDSIKNDKVICIVNLEFLTMELDKRINEHRKKATSTTSKLIILLKKVLDIYVNELSDDIVILKDDIYNKIKNFKSIYIKVNKSSDELDLKCLNDIDILLNSKSIKTYTGHDKEIIKPVPVLEDSKEKIELLNNNKNLKNKLKNAKDLLKESIKEKEQLEERLKLYPTLEEVAKTYKEVESIGLKNKQLQEDILNLKKQQEVLKNENLNLTKSNNELNKKQIQIEQYLQDNNIIKQNRSVSDYYTSIENRLKKQKMLDNKILNLLMIKDYTINELIKELNTTCKNINKDMIYESFLRLKNNYNIVEDSLKNYETSYILGFNDNCFKIENDDDYYDLIAISDLHISDSKSLINLNYIYEYAIKNNIKTILNLGDFFDPVIPDQTFMIEEDEKIEKLNIYTNLLEDTLKKLVYDDSITNLILGGNHDKVYYDIGIDAIKSLTNKRKDYIYLGYDHSIIKVNNSNVGMHHFNKRIASTNFIDKFNIKEDELVNLLNNYYIDNNMNRKDITIDLLGHYHVSKLSLNNSYISVPSLNRDHVQNGSWRIRLYFDSKRRINNIILIPLILDKKVYEASSITYTKHK